ncbi:MAG TPA: hypothetical protein VK172_10385 [Lentimicrobium sp.]|nr:hypothetical protein [Lentimicrobium sp.]
MGKFKQVQELNGIKVGMAIAFNDNGKPLTKVLAIFPNGNKHTTKDKPYYVENSVGALRYFSIDDFECSNINANDNDSNNSNNDNL